MRTFILLSAIPGSGKSTWAKLYQKEHPEAKIVSSDEIRLREFGRVDDFNHEKDVWRIFLEEIHEYGKDENAVVIADSTNINNYYRSFYAQEAKEYDKKVLVCFDIPYSIVLRQNAMRENDRVVPLRVMENMHENFEKPDEETLSLFQEYIVIDKTFIREDLKDK